jgi:hypothetical protein
MTDHADATDARELIYADPDAETVLDADDGLPTEQDAARLLLDLYDRSGGHLHHRQAVEGFLEEYGGRFVAMGREGFQISGEVRRWFEALAGREVVWDAQDRSWRWRHAWGVGPGAQGLTRLRAQTTGGAASRRGWR